MRLILAICSILIFAFAITGFQREYAPAIALQESEARTAQVLADLDMQEPPSSARILRELITMCSDSLRTVGLYNHDKLLLDNLRNSCATLAESTLQDSPSFSRAHILSLNSKPLQEVYPSDYHRSRMSAPYEPWPLSNRLLLAEKLAQAELLSPLEDEIAADIVSAMQTPWGRDFLAGIWYRQPQMRDFILMIAQTRPNEEQNHFLSSTRRALTNG